MNNNGNEVCQLELIVHRPKFIICVMLISSPNKTAATLFSQFDVMTNKYMGIRLKS